MDKGTMDRRSENSRRGGMTTGIMLAGAVSVLALPSAVLAFSNRFDALIAAPDSLSSLKSAQDQDPIAATLPVRSLAQGHLFPFTPARMSTRPDRSVTVAVRVDPQTAREITVSAARIDLPPASGAPQVRIAPTAFNLGVSRGYQSFVQTLVPHSELGKIDMPDLAALKAPGGQPGSSRFSPRITLDDKPAAGRAPRTFSGEEEKVDVGGAYRLTRNLDVTAGVRYSRERDRLRPLTDGKQDNQAVYVGTQFRF